MAARMAAPTAPRAAERRASLGASRSQIARIARIDANGLKSAAKVGALSALLLGACASPGLHVIQATPKWLAASTACVSLAALSVVVRTAHVALVRRADKPTLAQALAVAPLLYGWLAWIQAVLTTSSLAVAECWSLTALFGGAAITMAIAPTREEVRAATTVAAIVIAASVMVDAFGAPMREVAKRPSGLLANRNWSGQWLALALPIVLWFPRRPMERGVLALALGVALIFTRSRTAWNVALLEIVLCAWCCRRTAPKWILPVVVGGALAALLVRTLPTRLDWTQPYASSVRHLVDLSAGSGRVRVEQHRILPAIMNGRWVFGVGLGEWSAAASSESLALGLNLFPHSEWLRALVDGGLRLAIPLAVGFAGYLQRAARWASRGPDALALLAGVLVTSLLDVPLVRAESAVLVGMVGGFLATAHAASPVPAAVLASDPAMAPQAEIVAPGRLLLASASLAAIVCALGAWLYGRDHTLGTAARRAADRWAIPRDLLLAIAYGESRGVVTEHDAGLKGWTRLPPTRHPELVAARLHKSKGELQEDPRSGLEASAALLSLAADEVKLTDRRDLGNWREAVLAFNRNGDPLANELYWDQLAKVIRAGATGDGFSFVANPVDVPPPPPPLGSARAPGIAGASFVPFWPAAASSHRPPTTPGRRRVTSIVIHTMEGGFDVIFGYFRRPGVEVSSHYLVRSIDGLTTQMVDEQEVAFHDACFNDDSIGIEHEGFVSAGALWYSEAQYRASAKLVADIAKRNDVPIDRAHILGHGETPDCSDHTDPGPSWDWARYLDYVQKAAADVRP